MSFENTSGFLFFFLGCIFFSLLFLSKGKSLWSFSFMELFFKEVKEILSLSFNVFSSKVIYFSIFFLVFLSNLSGMFIFVSQNYLNKQSLSLILMALFMWLYSYIPFFFSQKEKFTLFVIGEMKFPILSFLLSNIEILTHLFRPITLSARLWVNIWVGHLITSSLSLVFTYQILTFSMKGFFSSSILQGGFFLFETGIMSLQTFVFSYLTKVYMEENFHFSSLTFKK